ncbi:MAG: sensor histidine kinase [Rhodoglobus sp.]
MSPDPQPTSTEPTSSAPPTDPPARPGGYLGLWRAMPRELLYLLIAFPIAVTGFSLTVGLFFTGVGTIVTFFIGILFLVAALYVGRGFGTVTINLVEWATTRPIARPEWQDARARTGFVGWLKSFFGNGHYWLYLLHTMVLDFIITTITWTLTIVWVSLALGGLTYWIWAPFADRNDGSAIFANRLADRLGSTLDPQLTATLLYIAIGVVFTLTLPLMTRGLTTIHWLVARGVLAAFKSDALLKQVADLNESRGAAISAEGHSLRRLERDIHDGPQQRLVRLQMDLAAAERQLDSDPETARTLIAEAMEQSKEALEELRALSRGFAPPILLDRGLIAALESAAVRGPIPTRVVDELPKSTELPQEIERNAYFVSSEALANAAKHSGASELEVRVGLAEGSLVVAVTDNGSGGAVATPDHGIAGLEERLRGLGGTLGVVSPEGGPTVITARLPLPAV